MINIKTKPPQGCDDVVVITLPLIVNYHYVIYGHKKKCTCGAEYTSNKNFHLKYCDKYENKS